MNIGDLVSIDDVEKAHVSAVLKKTPDLRESARVLGIDPATLYRKRKRWGMNKRGEWECLTDQPGAEPSQPDAT